LEDKASGEYTCIMEEFHDQIGKERNGYEIIMDSTKKATEKVKGRTYWRCVTEMNG
jgi:hypothetical protein